MAPILGSAVGLLPRSEHDRFTTDVMVEAEAEVAFDSRDILPLIEVPVLLIGGDRDVYFPLDLIRETARLIPDCHPPDLSRKGSCRSRHASQSGHGHHDVHGEEGNRGLTGPTRANEPPQGRASAGVHREGSTTRSVVDTGIEPREAGQLPATSLDGHTCSTTPWSKM
jgi:hypothetical protein